MSETILVTGATGYIASRLIPRLLQAGYQVRCMARQPGRLAGRTWFPLVEMVSADVTLPATLPSALLGVSAAFYLIHNMSAGHGYHALDIESARNFGLAARQAGVEHIIYLGGLADEQEPGLNLHMQSRIECGEALREAGVAVTEFRAGVIVGPGSVSFEMIRFLAEQFPLILGPTWLRNHSQPVAISNVLDYLIAALTTPAARGMVIQIGTQASFTYIELILLYARIRGLQRLPVLLPFVPVSMMVYLIDLLTPVERSYATPLVHGLKNDSLVLDRSPLFYFPGIKILDFESAVRHALEATHPARVERIWLDLDQEQVEVRHEGMLIDYRRLWLSAPAQSVFSDLLKLLSGAWRPGWQAQFRPDYQTSDTLRYKSIQKLPGEAWLEWHLTPRVGGTLLEQTTFYKPKGLPGFLRWFWLKPFYRRVFDQLIRRLELPV